MTKRKENLTKSKEVKATEKEVHQSFTAFTNFIKKNQLFLVTLLVMVLFGASILLASNVFVRATDTSQATESATIINFDQATIDKIKELQQFSGQVPPISESGRVNPFSD